MSWWLAGLIAGVVAYVADWVMWSKVFTKGMEAYADRPPAGQPTNLTPMLVKAGVLALVYGVVFAFIYRHFMDHLWTSAGVLGAMELATTLWLPLAFACVGSNVWYTKARNLMNAQMWAWLVRMNAAGVVVGLLVRSL
ncbi:MAG TPA: hypothetical protein VNI61_09845 [Gemmatimonadales bacterium]|nr:hypothetical protein [Gemmatimonadales bacterium]